MLVGRMHATPTENHTTDDSAALAALARAVADRGLAVPAVLVLEALRPLGFLTGQALFLVEPLLPSTAGKASGRAAWLLEDPERLARFLDLLAGPAAARPEERSSP